MCISDGAAKTAAPKLCEQQMVRRAAVSTLLARLQDLHVFVPEASTTAHGVSEGYCVSKEFGFVHTAMCIL